MAADRLAITSGAPGARRAEEVIFRLGISRKPSEDKFDPPGSQTVNRRGVIPIIEKYLKHENLDLTFAALHSYWRKC